MIECPNCERDFAGSTCRICGWSTTRTKPTPPTPKVPETHAPAKLPEFRPLTSEEDQAARAAIASLKRQPWWGPSRPRQEPASEKRLGLPDVDPRIRADLERRRGHPVALGEVVKAVIGQPSREA